MPPKKSKNKREFLKIVVPKQRNPKIPKPEIQI